MCVRDVLRVADLGSGGLVFGDHPADAFRQQGDVEGLVEDFVESSPHGHFQIDRGWFRTHQSNSDRVLVLGLASHVVRDNHSLLEANFGIDHDAIRIEYHGLHTSLKLAGCNLDLEPIAFRQTIAQAGNHREIEADEQNLARGLVFQLRQRHAVLIEEANQLLPRDAPVLAAGNPVATQTTAVEPLANGSRRHLADLRHLSGREHLLHLSLLAQLRAFRGF